MSRYILYIHIHKHTYTQTYTYIYIYINIYVMSYSIPQLLFRWRTSFSADQSKCIETLLRDRELVKSQYCTALIKQIQQTTLSSFRPQCPPELLLRPLQLLRMLSKPPQHRCLLTPQFIGSINEHMSQTINAPAVLIEILTLHLRIIEGSHTLITNEMYTKIIDLLTINNVSVTLVVLEIIREMTGRGVWRVFEELWYVGRLMYALERLQPVHKPRLVGTIKELLRHRVFFENFRMLNGVLNVINELKRAQSNFILRIALLSCIEYLTTTTQISYDFKLHNFTSLISLQMKEPLDYKETTLSIKILTHLMLDNDLNTKYVEEGLEEAIILLVRAHPTNAHMIKFDDIDIDHEEEAFEQFRVLLLRLLRYVCSLEKNRKIFKRIFPPELLGCFIDVGHFNKSSKAYRQVLETFNQLDNAVVVGIEEEYEKIKKMMKNKNFRLEVVGKYNLLEQLGQGAFGCVYFAKKGSNEYALKKIPVSGKDKNYFREVEIYKGLKHPNIIKFYESFVQDDYQYIVMEVVKGCNLSELIKNQNEKGVYFQEETIWRLVIAMLSVLRYLHCDKHIIHRDLNPSNIMVDNKFNIKVADFGLAKTVDSSLEMNSSFVGTLAYSSPQIVQNEAYNQKADIWSLGCIIAQVMLLRPPFAGRNPLSLAKNIVEDKALELPEQYSSELKSFVGMCLDRDQEKRQGVRELIRGVAERIMAYTDELKEKESGLCEEINHMNKKINGNLGATNTRLFGNSQYGGTSKVINEDALRQTQIVKIDSEILNKIGEDPISKFIDVVKKLSLIASTQTNLKKNFKKYVVDSFYNRVIISDSFQGNDMKNQLQKLVNLSKEEIQFLGVTFQLKQNYVKSITYEMLYFYIDELFQLIKKT